VALHTLGCRTNQAELAGFRDAIRSAGADVEFVAWDERADVYLLHSCTVTARADRQCRQKLHQARRAAPRARLVVSGCYAEREPGALAALPGVQVVLGRAARASVVSAVLGQTTSECAGVLEPPVDVPPIAADSRRTRAVLKVQEGCDHRCTYCVVPSVRGPSRSLPLRAVEEGARLLEAAGHPEIVLAGTHIGRWGLDLTPRSSLPRLLDALGETLQHARLRLSSLDPREVTLQLLHRLRDDPGICRHLHLSLQHTDPALLAAMGRPSETSAIVREAADRVPGLAIGADVIAGFPSEGPSAFERLLDELETLPLTYLHAFGFSARPGTAAARMEGGLPRSAISERVRALRALSEQVLRPRFLRSLVGTDLDVVVERQSADRLRGISSEYATVELPGDTASVGRRIGVRALGVDGSVVTGVLL